MKTKIKSMVLIMLFALSPAACEADLSELQWNWVIKPGEYEDVYFIAENKVVLKNTEGKYAIADLDEEIRTEIELAIENNEIEVEMSGNIGNNKR